MNERSAIVVGAGIMGLALVRALVLRRYKVKVFERTEKPVGASIRNFGMIWPIGQPGGEMYERAMRSLAIWRDISRQAGIWNDPVGSMHLAYHQDESDVLEEFYESSKKDRRLELLQPNQVCQKSVAAVAENLVSGLYSSDDLILDPRQVMTLLPAFFSEKYGVEFRWNNCVSNVSNNTVYIGMKEEHKADLIFACTGSDFETLFPEEYSKFPFTKCKLQMMRMITQPGKWRIGPALCGGLSLIHYSSFKASPSLRKLRRRFEEEMPEYIQWGIHVMVAQNEIGEVSVGDSHEYGLTHDPFDKYFINKLILEYLNGFARLKDNTITESWNGVYAKLANGNPDIFHSPQPGVYIVNHTGGAGMTHSFGFAEEVASRL